MTRQTIGKVAIGGPKSSFILRTRLEPRELAGCVDVWAGIIHLLITEPDLLP
jgi:hypothetical protein